MAKEKIEKRRTRAHTRAREKGLFFRVHPTFGVMGAEKKKSTEQIVDFPVSDLSIVANRSNKEADRTNSRYKTTISSLIWNKEKSAVFNPPFGRYVGYLADL